MNKEIINEKNHAVYLTKGKFLKTVEENDGLFYCILLSLASYSCKVTLLVYGNFIAFYFL